MSDAIAFFMFKKRKEYGIIPINSQVFTVGDSADKREHKDKERRLWNISS